MTAANCRLRPQPAHQVRHWLRAKGSLPPRRAAGPISVAPQGAAGYHKESRERVMFQTTKSDALATVPQSNHDASGKPPAIEIANSSKVYHWGKGEVVPAVDHLSLAVAGRAGASWLPHHRQAGK